MAPGGCHLGQDVSVPDPTHGNIELIPDNFPGIDPCDVDPAGHVGHPERIATTLPEDEQHPGTRLGYRLP